jgi:lipoprotein-anchoring transpeptidase ErfK/SrfK
MKLPRMRVAPVRATLLPLVTAASAVLLLASGNIASAAAPSGAIATLDAPAGQVGVAAPVTVTFAHPVTNRAAAERAIHLTTSTGQSGRVEWLNNQQLQWNPVGFWPAHSHIEITGAGYKTDVTTGPAVQGVASLSEHTFTVSIDGQVVRVMPASMGKPSRPTPQGSFTVLDKAETVVMDSRTIGIPLSSPEGYKITAHYAERITSGGVYVHSAPWSVDSQGHTNVSHGCINLSPDNAAWYYNNVHVGDPVVVKA